MKRKAVCRECTNGDKIWFLDGLFHREDGPAKERANGDKLWFLDGLLHREDGPAIEWASGHKDWYKNGKIYTPSAHELIIYKMKYEKKT
jgi:hypothetical protein